MRIKKAVIIPLCALVFAGSNAFGASHRVSLSDAIDSSIKNNLSIKLAAAQDEAARAQVLQSASFLLPNVLGTISQSRTFRYNINAVMGMGGVVGPFNTFDMRLQFTQQLLDLSAIKRYQAAKVGTELSAHSIELAKEQIAAAAALAYIEAARSRKAVVMAQADLNLAQRLLDLAQNQHDHGIVTGLDVARAKTRLSDARVFLLNAQSAERQNAIRLKRVAGWPLNADIELAEELEADVSEIGQVDTVIAKAENTRPDLKLFKAQLDIDLLRLSAAKSSRLPTLSISGNYGLSGNQADSNALSTSGIGAYLAVPLFTGGNITGAVEEARSAVAASSAKFDDARVMIEEDVRLSSEMAQEAQHEMALAQETVALAEQELQMSQDRYAQGVGDNIEVVTAQVELANVHNSYVTVMARNQAARVNLALSEGMARKFTLK